MFRLISRDLAPGQPIQERPATDWVASFEEAKSASQSVKFGGARGLFVEQKVSETRVVRHRLFR